MQFPVNIHGILLSLNEMAVNVNDILRSLLCILAPTLSKNIWCHG